MKYLSVNEVADQMGVTLSAVYKWIRLERLEIERDPLSNQMLISEELVEQMKKFRA